MEALKARIGFHSSKLLAKTRQTGLSRLALCGESRRQARQKTRHTFVALVPARGPIMSSAPMLSLDERERRARERAEQRSGRTGAAKANMSARSDLSSRRDNSSSPPQPGSGSLFDVYASLQDPHQFSTDQEEVEELMRMGVGYHEMSASDERYLEAGWDPSPHKNPPPTLAKLKPMTREPWTIDQQIYNEKMNTQDYGKPRRYGTDLFNMGTPVHEERDDPRKRPKGAKKGWDSQPFKTTPYALRGLKPSATATDPWVKDLRRLNASGFENTNVIEDSTLTELDNGGEQRFKKGAFNAYKNERNRRLHKDAWDTSTRTW